MLCATSRPDNGPDVVLSNYLFVKVPSSVPVLDCLVRSARSEFWVGVVDYSGRCTDLFSGGPAGPSAPESRDTGGAAPPGHEWEVAMNTSTVTVTGTVVFDPVMRTTETGQVVTNVRVAANDRRLNRTTQEWEDVNTSFYNVSCWRVLGEGVAPRSRKGDP